MTDYADTISSDEPEPSRGSHLRETPSRGAGVRTTAMSAALTLVVSAGVATAAYRGTKGGNDPAVLIPADAFAVATLDFGLPNGQEDAIDAMLSRFPGLHLPGDGSLKDRVVRALTQDSDPPVDYDKDVKPWLGDHVAFAGWLDDGHPKLEVVMESRDDDAARKHLTAAFAPDAHYVLRDGYVVIGDKQSDVDDAVAAAGKASLADAAHYADDISELPDGEAVTAWLDGPKLKEVLADAFGPGIGGTSALGGFEMMGDLSIGDFFKGRLSLGLHVADDYVQLDMHDFGGPATRSAPSTMLTSLPAGTIGALEIGDPAAVVDGVGRVAAMLGPLFSGGGGSCAVTAEPVSPLGAMSRRQLLHQLKTSLPPTTPHRKAIIRHVLRNHHKALVKLHKLNTGDYVPPESSCTTSPPPAPPMDPSAALSAFLGINFPDDVKTILGDRAVVSFGGLQLAGLPDVAIRSHPTDLTTAQSLAETLRSQLSSRTGFGVAVNTVENDLVLATSAAYGEQVAKPGTLGDQAQAKSALGDLPDAVEAAGYVDLSRIWPLIGAGVPDAVQHLKAVGFWATGSDDEQTAQLRLVIR